MGKDLFSCDLEQLVFSDVEDFVALDIEEGLRVDYKDQIPQKIGDLATAFSNAIGGLGLLGVATANGRPSAIPGIARNAKSDLKTQIANKIISTVHPRPTFSIGVVPHSTAGFDVAVLRVEEGIETPYIFLPDKKVSVRIEDQNERAGLSDLDRLYHRRAAGVNAHVANEDRDIFVLADEPHNRGQTRAETYLKCWLWPTQSLDLRLDRKRSCIPRTDGAGVS